MPDLDRTRQKAFRCIFEAEFSYVWRSLRFLGVHANDVGDVTHDVFLKVLRLLDQYDPSRPFRPWLFRIVFHAASDYRRLARHRREVLGPAEVEDEAPGPDETIAHRQELDLVLGMLEGIEPGQRAVFVLHEIHGQAMPEIADALDIPLNTAYSRLRLAREQFAAATSRMQLRRGGQ